MRELPKVAVCGVGGTGLGIASDLAFMGCKVSLFALDRSKDKIRSIAEHGGIEMTGEESQSGKTGFAPIYKATTDPEEAIEDVKLIMIAVPVYAHEAFFRAFVPHLEDGQNILVNTGYFASLRFADMLKKEGVFDRVTMADGDIGPYVVRRMSPTACHIYKVKRKLALATFPGKKTSEILRIVKPFYPQYRQEPNVLWTNLGPGNPPVHPTLTIPIAGIFERYGGCNFYREATMCGGRLLEEFDKERLKVAEKLGCKVRSEIGWFREAYGYEGEEISEMLQRSAHAKAHTTAEHSEALLTEDIAYCYVPMSELGDVSGVPTPVTKAIIEVLGVMLNTNFWETGVTLKDLGLAGLTADEIVRYVNTGET